MPPPSTANQASSGTTNWRLEILEPSRVAADYAKLKRLRIANHHATELVTRLLAENRAQRRLIHRALHRHAAVSARLLNWLEGDGTKPREVLADLEEILGRG